MQPGSKVADYEVLHALGGGGMGSVYAVRDPRRPDAPLAIKLAQVSGEEACARFLREGELLARVRHPQVVRVHDRGQSEAGPYLLMERIEGRSLDEVLEQGPLPVARAARLLSGLCGAVEALHAVGVLHRDLKPANVMLRDDGTPVLIDFGLASAADASRLTQTGQWVGTAGYASPEQRGKLGRVELDARADVYALGAILLRTVSGREPAFGGASLLESGVDASIRAVCARAMARDREARYPSVAELRADLERVVQGTAPTTPRPAPSTPRSRVWLLAVPALALGATAALWQLTGDEATSTRDTPSLELELESPTHEQRCTQPELEVRGRIDPPQKGLRVWVGKRSVVPHVSGEFRVRVFLEEGENTIEVTLKRGAEVVLPPLRRTVILNTQPAWYSGLPEARRAPTPLPSGIRFGDRELEYINERDGSVLVFCPPGTFEMGCPREFAVFKNTVSGTVPDWPPHPVTLTRGFFVGRYELTWKHFWRFNEATGSEPLPPIHGDTDDLLDHPVHGVSWAMAMGYCEWARLRLPSEAEWEYAARGPGVGPLAPWLEPGQPLMPESDGERHCLTQDGRVGSTCAVGSFPEVQSPFGCFDMAGNVAEIAQDAPRRYTETPVTDPLNEHSRTCTLKGAGWNAPLYMAQPTARWTLSKFYTRGRPGLTADMGFRVARDAR